MTGPALIDTVLPKGTVGAETFGQRTVAALHPDEAPIVANAIARRQSEFAAGRSVARRALQTIGFAPGPILKGKHGEPKWPAGVVGAITHTHGYCAAAVARLGAIAAIGIDAEVLAPLPDDVIDLVTRTEEREWILARASDGMYWDSLLFSAKESVFKAWFPMTRRWLGFQDVSVRLDPASGTFNAQLLVDPAILAGRAITDFNGQFTVSGGYIVTAVVLRHCGQR